MRREAREVILERIREARSAPERSPAAGGRAGPSTSAPYRTQGDRSRRAVLDLLVDRISDYRASVVRTTEEGFPGEIRAALARLGSRRLVIPSDLPREWLGASPVQDLEILRDPVEPGGGQLSNGQLAACYGVLTGCALAIAETGTLVLDGGPRQGRRALSLLPDHHLCVVFQDQVVETVPQALAAMESLSGFRKRPFTLISGPSATSDIELVRVEGVHGPRNLEVLLVEEP